MARQSPHSFLLLGPILAAACLAASPLARGQAPATFAPTTPEYERLAPKTPPAPAKRAPKPEALKAEGDDKVLVARLEGLLFLDDLSKVRKGAAPEKGLVIEGLPLLDCADFRGRVAPFLGKPVSLRAINEACKQVRDFYVKRDRPWVLVYAPAGQDISSGTVQVVVREGRLGRLKTEGNRWFDSSLIEGYVPVQPGDPILATPLLRGLNQLNANPFRHADLVAEPGQQPGEVDLTLKTKDRFPVRFFGGYEDSGNIPTGFERYLGGFNWGNVFGLDHQFNYQFMGDHRFNKITVHSGSYVVPLTWGDRLSFFGYRQEVKEDTDLNPLIDNRSEAWQASARYNYRLPDLGALLHEAIAGADFKQSHLTSIVAGQTTYNNVTDVAQLTLGYNASLPDAWGSTAFGGNAFWSPGGVTAHNDNNDFRNVTAFTGADYYYARMTLQRDFALPAGVEWMLKGTWQVSPGGNLLESERLGLGGADSVRGYDERIASGDEGWILTTELRAPAFSPGALCGFDGAPDRLQFLGFLDYGVAEKKLLRPGVDDPHVILWGVGPGLRYTINPWLSVRADYGFQMRDLVESGFPSRFNSRWHLSMVVAY
jgi:hemolysin activation/secretion protein